MTRLIQMQVSDELYADLEAKAKILDQTVAAYCRSTLAGLARGVFTAVITPPKPEPKSSDQPISEDEAWIKRETILRKERKLYGGRTINEWVDYYSGPYEKIDVEDRSNAHLNLPIWMELKAEKDKVPLEELQAKYKVQKPKASNTPKPTKPAVVDPYEGDDAHDEYDHIIKALEAEDAARMNVGSK